MATSYPLVNIPTIVEVMDPGDGKYSVFVKMDGALANKFPNKAWNVTITEIGLATKDSDRFPGYVLTRVDSMKGSPDLLWVFESLPGPVWDTVTRSRDNLTPAKFRGNILKTQLKQDVLPGTATTALTGDLVLSEVQRQENTGKSVKVNVTEVIAEGAALTGKVAYVERTTGSTSEGLVVDGTAAESGLLIVDSRVSPLGNGKSVKDTTSVASWPEHTGSRWDESLNAAVLFTEQFIVPGAALATPYTDEKIVNEHRNLRHTEVVPTDALEDYHSQVPCRINLGDLPRELLSVNVVWNTQYSIGTQDYAFSKVVSGDSWSLSASADDQASSAASLMPEVQLRFRDIASSNLPGTRHEIYVSVPVTEAKIRSRLGAKIWPVFKPESTTITATGQSIRVSVSCQASLAGVVEDNVVTEQGWSKGTSDDFSVGLSNNSIQIPACIHRALAFTGQTSRFQLVSATALIGMTNSVVGSITSTRTKAGTAYGAVTPTSLSATGTNTRIPTSGTYIIGEPQVSRPRWGYCLVTVDTFNAASLA